MKYDTVQHKKYVGFIGLGAMGSSVTRNLVNADYDLCLYHVRKEAMDSFPETRTMKASSPLDVGNAAEVCFLMVNTYEQCLSVLTGAKGLLSGNRCKTLILLSTVAPQDAVAIGKECQTHGVQLLDCPVSGGTKGAADGTLTLMVAGPEKTYQDCTPLLQAFSSKIFFIGEEVGMGQSMKAVNQLLFGEQMVAMAEAVVFAEKSGIPPNRVFEVISNCAGCSNVFMSRMPSVIKRDFSTRSTLDIQVKDMNICLQAGEKNQAPLFLTSVAKEIFKLARKDIDPREDSSAVVKFYENLAGVDPEKL